MKSVLIAIFAFSSLAARAEVVDTVCNTHDKSTVVNVSVQFPGTYEELSFDAPASGHMFVEKYKGRAFNKQVPITGTVTSSAKGPYFELSGRKRYSLFISAAASNSPSEFVVDGKTTYLTCY